MLYTLRKMEKRKDCDRRQCERRTYDRRCEHKTPEYRELEYELRCKNEEIQKLKDEIHTMNNDLFG